MEVRPRRRRSGCLMRDSIELAAAASGIDLQLLGLVITAGASVLVALIGGNALVKAKRTPAPAEPVPVQDVWEENRKVRNEIRELRGELRTVHGALGVSLRWMQRAIRDWGTGYPPPPLSEAEIELLEKAGGPLPFDPEWDEPIDGSIERTS